jgi:hypothetical protein
VPAADAVDCALIVDDSQVIERKTKAKDNEEFEMFYFQTRCC